MVSIRKNVTLILGILLSLMLAFSAVPAFAVDGEGGQDAKGYPHTITVYPGEGTIAGSKDPVTFTLYPAQYGNGVVQVNLQDVRSAAKPTDSRYYVKGIRLAGQDNTECISELAFPIEGDAQYVVAYGLQKDLVAYRVDYVDANGNQIRESETLYGNIGDKPVVAYRYVEGYLPAAYNLTKTLSENEADNVFTFTYNAVTGTAAAGGAGDAGTAVAPPPTDAGATAAAAADGTLIGDDGTPLAEPEGTVDLDDNENPLAGEVSDEGAANPVQGLLPYIAVAIPLIALVAVIAAFLYYRKRQKGNDVAA